MKKLIFAVAALILGAGLASAAPAHNNSGQMFPPSAGYTQGGDA